MRAFAKCTSLKSFKIPLSVVELGGFAFDGCTALEEAYISAKLYAKSTGIFNGCTKLDSGKPTIYSYADPGEEGSEGNFGFKVSFAHIGICQSRGSEETISSSYIDNTLGSEYRISPFCSYGLPG